MNNGRTVTVGLSGGLGNQLFQYATARALALRNAAQLRLDTESGYVRDWYQARFVLDKFEILPALPRVSPYASTLGAARRRAVRALNGRVPMSLRSHIFEPDVRDPTDLLRLRLRRDVYLEGYWADERYFRDIRALLLREFNVHGPLGAVNDRLAACIRGSRSVAVHVLRLRGQPNRDTSVPLVGRDDQQVPVEYYHRAVARLASARDVDRVFVFADYPDWARENLSFSLPTTFVGENGMGRDYCDFWLMRQCNHFVIANSTFSWWAAWLGECEEKAVVVPAQYLDRRRGLASAPANWWRM